LLTGDIGCEGDDAPVRLGSQLARRRLQIHLVPRHDRHIGPFAGQFPRDGLANAPTAAGHDRMLVLQSEVHGILSPWRRDQILLPHYSLFSLRKPGARMLPDAGDAGTAYMPPAQRPPSEHGYMRRIPSQSRGWRAP